MSDHFSVSFNPHTRESNQLFSHKLRVPEKTSTQPPSNTPVKTDRLTIDPSNKNAIEDITLPVRSSDESNPTSVTIQNIRRDASNPNRAVGDINLSPLGLGTHQTALTQDRNGEWVSASPVRTLASKFNGSELYANIEVTSDGLTVDIDTDSSNGVYREAVRSLNAIYQTDIISGTRALQTLQQLQNHGEETIRSFLSGLNAISSNSSATTENKLNDYLSLIGRHTSQTTEIADRLANLEGGNIGNFLNASIQSRGNFVQFVDYLDYYDRVDGYDFLETAVQSEDRLETLLDQMDRFNEDALSDFAAVFSNLSPESIGTFADQLERADRGQIEGLLSSSVQSGESADIFITQLNRTNDEQFDALADLSSEAGEWVGELSRQFDRIESDQLESMFNVSQKALANDRLPLFLEQMERVSDEDAQSFIEVLEQSGDRFNDYLNQTLRVEDEDLSDFIAISSKMGDSLPAFLDQMKRFSNTDLYQAIQGFKNIDAEEYDSVLEGMSRLNESNLLPFLSYLKNAKPDSESLSNAFNSKPDINQIDWNSIRQFGVY